MLYVDISNQLDTNESLSTISLSSNIDSLNLTSPTILTGDITTKDGHILPADKSIVFRAACATEQNSLAAITIQYSTDANNYDSTIVYLKIVPQII